MDGDAYRLCADLYGGCRCEVAARPPCDAMLALVADGEGPDDERNRMETARDDAATEHEF